MEFDLLLAFQIAGALIAGWFVVTQVVIPLRNGKSLLPAFRQHNVLEEVSGRRKEQLRKEIEFARSEKELRELEAELEKLRNQDQDKGTK